MLSGRKASDIKARNVPNLLSRSNFLPEWHEGSTWLITYQKFSVAPLLTAVGGLVKREEPSVIEAPRCEVVVDAPPSQNRNNCTPPHVPGEGAGAKTERSRKVKDTADASTVQSVLNPASTHLRRDESYPATLHRLVTTKRGRKPSKHILLPD